MRHYVKSSLYSAMVVLGTSALLTGCGSTSSTNSSNASSTSNSKFQGTITMYAGSYGPPTTQNQVKGVTIPQTTELATLAKQWEAKHPGITIKFIHSLPSNQNYDTYVRTKASGGQLPDIIWDQWMSVNDLPSGMFVNLTPSLKQADPYVQGKQWGQVLNPQVMSETAAPNGDNYIIDADYVGQGVFYNKDAFKKAGITQLPTTWTQFMDDSKKLKAAGYTPWAWDASSTHGWDRIGWLTRLLYTNFYSGDWNNLRYTGHPAMTAEDEVIAIKNGVYGPSSKKWMEGWKLIKDSSQYWQKDFTGGDGNLLPLFLKGKVGMYFSGTWDVANIKSANPSFQWGTFPDPYPTTATTQYATSFNSSASVGGPNGAFQYAVSAKKADNTMTPAKIKASIDWLEFITTPKNDSAIVNQLGEYIPTVVGAKPVAAMSNWSSLANQPLEEQMGGIMLTNSEVEAIWRSYQGVLLGQTSLQQFGQTAGQVMNKTADQLIKQNHWDISKYLTKH